MGLAIKNDSIGIYKAYIKDIDSLKDLVLPSLFGKSNKFNLGPVPSFLPIFTVVEELLIAYIYIYLQVVCVCGQQYCYTRYVSTLAKTHQRLKNNYYGYLLNLIY